jgi:hypothetical protein
VALINSLLAQISKPIPYRLCFAIHNVRQTARTLVSGMAGQPNNTEWLIDHGEGQLDKH